MTPLPGPNGTVGMVGVTGDRITPERCCWKESLVAAGLAGRAGA